MKWLLNNATALKWILNFYPPYWGTGIWIKHIAADFSAVDIMMKFRFYNVNYVGCHYGGSLYSMADPFFMLMVMQLLGKEYHVWDKIGEIEYVKPGKGTIRANFRVSKEEIAAIKAEAEAGEKIFPTFSVQLLDHNDEVISIVKKTLYVRKKPRFRD